MNTLLSFFLGWKVKLLVLVIVLGSLFAWHRVEVNKAVTKAVAEVELQVHREKFKLLDKANEESIKLKEQLTRNKQEKDRELQAANSKYNALSEWVHNLPSTTSDSNISRDTGDSEARSEEVIAELRRRHANSFARYSFDAEEVKVHLVQCYKDYDAAKVSIDKFLKENASKSP
jgi:hypothetical protein